MPEQVPAVSNETAPVALAATSFTPAQMLDRAISSGASVEVLEKLMALSERHDENAARRAFDAAIATAKAEIGPIRKNRKVDYTTSKGRTSYEFEDLAEISRTVDPILAAHGLSYRWRTDQTDREVVVSCVVAHRDGYSEETTLSGPLDQSGSKNAIQSIGSTVTFLQRYTLKAALGLAVAADDDAQAVQQAAGTISARDAEQIRILIDQTDTDEARFLKAAKAESIEDIPASQVARLKALLERKLREQEAAKAEGQADA